MTTETQDYAQVFNNGITNATAGMIVIPMPEWYDKLSKHAFGTTKSTNNEKKEFIMYLYKCYISYCIQQGVAVTLAMLVSLTDTFTGVFISIFILWAIVGACRVSMLHSVPAQFDKNKYVELIMPAPFINNIYLVIIAMCIPHVSSSVLVRMICYMLSLDIVTNIAVYCMRKEIILSHLMYCSRFCAAESSKNIYQFVCMIHP